LSIKISPLFWFFPLLPLTQISVLITACGCTGFSFSLSDVNGSDAFCSISFVYSLIRGVSLYVCNFRLLHLLHCYYFDGRLSPKFSRFVDCASKYNDSLFSLTWCTYSLFIIHFLHSSTCFEHYYAYLQEVNCISTASGIVTVFRWLFSTQITRGLGLF
jgi:hypothetical protein